MKSQAQIRVYKRKKGPSLDKNENRDAQNLCEGFLSPVDKKKRRIETKNGQHSLATSKLRNSFKLIAYPTNHYNCWVSPLKNESENNLFLNSILKEAIKLLTKQQIINRMREQTCRWEKIKQKPRFSTEPIHRFPSKQFKNKIKDNRENFKVTRLFIENNYTEPSMPSKNHSNNSIRPKD